jgi:ribosomal RNA-processing protein 8
VLNEQLYRGDGATAVRLLREPGAFDAYHDGFRKQVQKWPENPVDVFIARLQTEPRELVVADFGCGDAELARRAPQRTVHSFDVVAADERVTACDIGRVPLPDASVDVGIFSLALMGTDYQRFLREAHRVLRPGARLWIAEVRSRFEQPLPFARQVLPSLGFDGVKMNKRNEFFIMFDAVRAQRAPPPDAAVPFPLKPCLYKKR